MAPLEVKGYNYYSTRSGFSRGEIKQAPPNVTVNTECAEMPPCKTKQFLGACTVHGMTSIFNAFGLRHGDTENEELQAAV